ncbi:signal peptidase I [Agromyces sp. SYSU K20354]|uniref:signal peptidase I n=1 Tax=Agromyces cavernae TaxID=2898659 RepID=UPI001E429CB9|nr:signal peptidase I [Agromyces cavernae]MCD2443963.1 signal peptidase I [Agromyces cavernae]
MRIRRWPELIVAGVVAGLAVAMPAPGTERVRVASDSMAPTVLDGDWVTVGAVGARGVQRRDLVMLASPDDGKLLLKRVVAIGGDEVGIEDGVLVVNRAEVDEPFVDYARVNGEYFGPVRVAAGHVFVLGDNRGSSVDSRAFGAVPLAAVAGTVVGVDVVRTIPDQAPRSVVDAGEPGDLGLIPGLLGRDTR